MQRQKEKVHQRIYCSHLDVCNKGELLAFSGGNLTFIPYWCYMNATEVNIIEYKAGFSNVTNTEMQMAYVQF